MPFNSNQGYPQQPFGSGGAHPVAKITQPISFGAMSMRRYGSFAGRLPTITPLYNPAKFSGATDDAAFTESAADAVFSSSTNDASYGSAD